LNSFSTGDPLTWFDASLLKWRGGDTYNIRYKGDPEDGIANEFDGQIDPWRQRASLSVSDYVLLPSSSFQKKKISNSKKRKTNEEDEWVAGRVVKAYTPTHVVVRMDRSSRDVELDTRIGIWRIDGSKNGSSRNKRRRR